MIVSDDSRVINKLEASLTDDDRVIIYDRHMFIVQAPGVDLTKGQGKLTYTFSAERQLLSATLHPPPTHPHPPPAGNTLT